MTDTFGIFREDSVPVLRGVPKDIPSFIKGKGGAQNIKKKALGDVSNLVSQKLFNTQPNEISGKLAAEACGAAQQDVSCKPIAEVKLVAEEKETFREPSNVCVCCYYIAESDYDIVPKSDRLSEEATDRFTTFYPQKPYSPPAKANFELPELPTTPPSIFSLDAMHARMDEELEESPMMDISLPDSDLLDLSF